MKELKFIHITKCAGTSIENIGKRHNILWGKFHKEYGWWHGIFQNKSLEMKLKYEWFIIVRNPYERLISEFYCKWAQNWTEKWVGKDVRKKIRKIICSKKKDAYRCV